MRTDELLPKFGLREKPAPCHPISDTQFARQLLEFEQLRTFSGDGEMRVRINARKLGKCAQAGAQSFLLDQASRLEKSPAAVVRPNARCEWNFPQRNSRALQSDLLRSAAELDERFLKRLGANEDEANGGQHLLRRDSVGRLVEI